MRKTVYAICFLLMMGLASCSNSTSSKLDKLENLKKDVEKLRQKIKDIDRKIEDKDDELEKAFKDIDTDKLSESEKNEYYNLQSFYN